MIRKNNPLLTEHRAMFERLAYFAFLTVVVSGIGWTALGLIIGLTTGDYRAFCAGLGGVMLASVVQPWGYKHWHFQECEASLSYHRETAYGVDDVEHDQRSEALRAVFRELAALRDCRGAEVWEVQRLRAEARKLLLADGTLRADFEEELAQYPELLPG